MTIASGIGSQLGFGVESTVGTRVVPSRFLEFLSEGIKNTVVYVDGKGIKTGRRVLRRRHKLGAFAQGPIAMELAPQSTALLFKHAIGTSVIAGANPYTHTITPGPLDGLGLSVQLNRPDIGGVDRVFDYSGMQITKWALSCKVGEIATFTPEFYGMVEVTNQTLGSASYPTGWMPFTCVQAVVSIAGAAYDVLDLTVTGDNHLATGRFQIRTTTPTQPKKSLEMGTREYGGTINSDFIDLTAYARSIAQTAAALVITFTAGSTIMTISGNVEFDSDTPTVDGEQTLTQGLPFKFLSETSDAAALTIVITNADAAD